MTRTLVWFRGKELRVSDHRPLHEAASQGEVICAFVLDPFFFAPARARELPHRMQYLLDSIDALARNLETRGANLVLLGGKSIDTIPRVARTWKVTRVVAQRWTEPFARKRDEIVAKRLGVPFDLFEGETLAPPGSVRTQADTPFSVFTPFARAFRETTDVGAPLRAPRAIKAADVVSEVELPALEDLGITRNPRVVHGGERAARDRLTRFLRDSASRYPDERDRMDHAATSHLSQDLKFGTLSPRTAWHAAHDALAKKHPKAWRVFSNELVWRDFAHSVLWENPSLLERPRRPELHHVGSKSETAWTAWAIGKTGYPIVDAAARQLLGEGFVHNRARMISASFLTKDLRIDYRRGEAHYMRYLVDGDWAQNNFNWQWVAGCGFDAAPFFRVFNPSEQGKRFDPNGDYVRRWVPELARVPAKWIHEPWRAPADVLRAAHVEIGTTYPRPIVDHAEARGEYLAMMRET